MSLHNVELPADYAQGAVVSMTYLTTIVTDSTGREQRNVNWDIGLLKADISHLLIDRASRDAMISFFRARRGRGYAFLFQDWTDFFVGMAYVADVLSHTGAHNFAVGNGSQTVFKIYKVYNSGGYTENRRITRPKSPIRVYLNGTQQVSGFTVDYTLGTITFASAPAGGVNVGWSGEFRVPVRFDTDEPSVKASGPELGETPSLTLIEVREDA